MSGVSGIRVTSAVHTQDSHRSKAARWTAGPALAALASLAACVLLWPCSAPAQDHWGWGQAQQRNQGSKRSDEDKQIKTGQWEGVVVRVTDGDSLWIKSAQGQAIEVRLSEMDAPESCQAWGPESRVALRRIAMGKTATMESVARDRYGRTVARVQIGGLDLGPHLVMHGHAWSQRGPWGDGPLVKEEQAARAAKRGLHAAPNPVLPSDFRRKHGSCYAGRGGSRASAPRAGLR
jgi:micrococcal nuclease